MPTFQLLLILLLLAVGLYFYRREHIQRKIKKDVLGRLWVTFYTKIGNSYSLLCDTDNHEVAAPESALKALKDKVGSTAVYLVDEQSTFDIAYPPGKPDWMQTIIQHTAYYEGNPVPIISRDPAKNLLPDRSAKYFATIRNEKMMGHMVRTGDDIEEYRKAAMNKISAKVVYTLLVGIIIMLVINVAFSFNAVDQVSKIIRYWGL